MSDLTSNTFEFLSNTIRPDGLVNATALTTAYRLATISEAKPTGVRKDVRDWLVTQEAKASIAYLELSTGIPREDLVVVENGEGTWVHADLAEILAQWISVEYRFAVVALIRQEKAKAKPKELSNRELALMVIAEADRADALAAQIEADKEATTHGNMVSKASNCRDVGSFGKTLNPVRGRTTMFKELRELGFIMQKGVLPYQAHINNGLFEVIQVITQLPNGTTRTDSKTLITGKGELAITNAIKTALAIEISTAQVENVLTLVD